MGAALADIDEAQLWSFAREFEGDALNDKVASNYLTGDLLERELMLAVGSGSEITPTVAGLLLFGRNERVAALLPRSAATMVRFAGDTMQAPEVEHLQLTGNLSTLYDHALKFIARYCDLWNERPRSFPGDAASDAPVVARGNYHRGVVEEAVANALAHRDLALRDHATRIHVFDHSLEILNARRTAGFGPVPQRAIRYGVPQRLNPQIAAIFSSPAYDLKLRRGGLPALLRTSRLFSNRRAEIHAFNDEFRLRIYSA
ncbi:MAG: hypothetical protein WKF30_16885 [Pyrinomonadaceae bacterium]